MSTRSNYRERLANNPSKNQEIRSKAVYNIINRGFNTPTIVVIQYSGFIFLMAELFNWLFTLPIVQGSFSQVFHDLYLEALFNYFHGEMLLSSQAYVHATEKIVIFSSWLWLIAYSLLALFTGIIHFQLYKVSNFFKTTVETCLFVSLFKLVLLTMQSGFLQILTLGKEEIIQKVTELVTHIYLDVFAVFSISALFFFLGIELAFFFYYQDKAKKGR